MGAQKALVSRSRGVLFLAASAALLSTACGPAPRGAYDERGEEQPAQGAGQPQTIYIVMGEGQQEPVDTWVPPADHGENPFERTRTWVGDYDCPQGNTQLTLRVLGVRGSRIRAIFDFNHIESGASGKYLTVGNYDEQTHTVTFRPTKWLVRPPHYEFVPMRGDVSMDGTLFAGRIMHPACGAFRLRPAG